MTPALENIKCLVFKEFEAVNALIVANLSQEIALIDELCHYVIDNGGKRLRPLIVLLAAKACGYEGNSHIELAAAVEYFHTATLLHDDVVDESTLRRGQETANEIWGGKTCILVGDYLFTQSVEWIITTKNWEIVDLFVKMSRQISRGELKQLQFRHNIAITLADYFEIIRSKTALLFSTAATLGGYLTHSASEVVEGLRNYGLHLGNAFQMIDDALDYCSKTEILGKNIGDDLADGKITLPLFYAMQHGTKEQVDLIKSSIQQGSLEKLNEVSSIIQETKAVDYTYALARKEISFAVEALQVLKDSVYKQGLLQLADFAVARMY